MRKTEINKLPDFRKLADHPVVSNSLNSYAKQEYATPLFVLRQTLAGFGRHNIMSLSASLSFYALFALIPMILLIFFLLSHLVYSSDYAIVKLAILTGNLVPDLSGKIMVEVYNATQTKAAWGALGLIVLLWSITPLASAMRASFYVISAKIEMPSFVARQVKDVLSVLGILLLFFLFTSAGFLLESVVRFLANHFSTFQLNLLGSVFTLVLTTLLITSFYRVFFPMRVAFSHLLIGASATALLWLAMRPAFGLFLSINESYGAIFGSMKALFVSITWLYLNFAVFLFGTELIATLRKMDVLLLKGLFDNVPNKANYIAALMQRYGKTWKQDEKIIELGNIERNLYFIVEGTVHITKNDIVRNILKSGDYFGETAMLADLPADADAVVASEEAQIIVIYAENIDTMLAEDPKVAMQLLRHLANRLQHT
ncbi:MAG: cyclic nucleotide-binding protein [Methylophilales bacterium 28-44-11]|nr:MAG: cyclic nucleotide-binding protein [Methylophilales bacterium 28-44-11]